MKKAPTAHVKQLEDQKKLSQERLAKLDEYDRKLAEGRAKAQNDQVKVLNLTNQISEAQKELSKYEEDSAEYGEIYKKIVEDTIQLESIQSKLADERQKKLNAAAKKAADEKKRAEETAKKEAEAEAKRLADKKKTQDEARKEFELELKIRQMEAVGYTKQADAIKNALERNKLMETYGYTIEEANKKLKEQKELEKKDGDKVEYSKDDIKKAERILKRGAGGSVGKETLAQAQAIVDGKAIEGNAVSMFRDAKKNAKKADADVPIATDEQIARASKWTYKQGEPVKASAVETAKASAVAAETPQPKEKNKESAPAEKTADKSPEILEINRKLYQTLEDIKTSFNQFLRQYKTA